MDASSDGARSAAKRPARPSQFAGVRNAGRPVAEGGRLGPAGWPLNDQDCHARNLDQREASRCSQLHNAERILPKETCRVSSIMILRINLTPDADLLLSTVGLQM
jgi:hypothetical protein